MILQKSFTVIDKSTFEITNFRTFQQKIFFSENRVEFRIMKNTTKKFSALTFRTSGPGAARVGAWGPALPSRVSGGHGRERDTYIVCVWKCLLSVLCCCSPFNFGRLVTYMPTVVEWECIP